MHYVFVYGTLKKGRGLHTILEGSECVATDAYTLDNDFKMVYSMGERGFPFVFRTEDGSGRHVKGEVYEVDDDTLAALDAAEGVPYMYKRESITFTGIDPEDEMCYVACAYMYISPVERNGTECGPEDADYYEWG